MKPQVPSLDSSQETLSTFLANDDYRKSWNILLDTAKQYRNLEANNWFLSQCIALNTIPQSFVSSCKAKNNKSSSFKKEWSEQLKHQSLTLMKDVLNDDDKKLTDLFNDVHLKYNQIPLGTVSVT